MTVNWSRLALADIQSIRSFIAETNPAAAARVAIAIVQFVEGHLGRFPNAGRPGRVAGTRELVLPRFPYVIPYRVAGDNIIVLRFYHAARRWPRSL